MATIGWLSLKLKWSKSKAHQLEEDLAKLARELVCIRKELMEMNIMYENRLRSKENSIDALKNKILGRIDESSYIRSGADDIELSEEQATSLPIPLKDGKRPK